MSEVSELLATLADVHEPPAPDVGVPWLLLLNAALAFALLTAVAVRTYRRRTRWRRDALSELDRVRDAPPEVALPALATVLRRVARLHVGERVATLDGDAWLDRLDRLFRTDWFSRGDGRAFGSALYRPTAMTPVESGRLNRAVARHLRRLPARPASPRP